MGTGCGGGADHVAPIDVASPAPAPAIDRLPNGDRDHDGVPNGRDACPLLAEDIDQIDDDDGCPEDDADGDEIADRDDACPKEPGIRDLSPQRNGCAPHVSIGTPYIPIVPRLSFGYGEATKIADSDLAILDAVAEVMKAHPEITKLEIQGDASTDEPDPTTLGEKRAKLVLDAIVSRGVDAGRLVARGYGASRPLERGDTSADRAKNRRVGFLVLESSP